MKTKAVRIHGKMDLRLEEIELPQVGPDDVQVKIISDSICMSTYKAAVEGEEHKRVPNDVAEHPTIVGHEFCGVITEVGENWKNKYKAGQGFAIQPAHFYKGSQMAPGYSYQYCGGDSQYSNIPIETLLTDNLLPYNSDTYFYGSLAEPMSCIIGTFHAMYHTKPGCYEHQMGIVEGGKMAMLASVGPMGLGAIDYALHCDRRPSLLVITATTSKSDDATTHVPKTRQESHLIVTLLPYHHTVVQRASTVCQIRDLLTLDSSYAGKHLTLDSLEHCAATSRYVAHLVSKAELVDSGHRVATAYQ